jgi:hypothetical protein
MKNARRPLGPLLALVLAFAAASPAPGASPSSSAASPARFPKLAVVVSIDGLSFSRLEEYRGWYVAGLKRLLDEGYVERAARYHHLNTETGPGHAALGTGSPPRVTGIVANRWFEARQDGSLRVVYCTDEREPSSPDGAPAFYPGAAKLQVPTLGDRLVAAHPGARVVSVSGKDRGAIFLAGKDPRHAVYWYEQRSGRFVSSPAYPPTTPFARAVAAIVERFDGSPADALYPRFGRFWKRLPDTGGTREDRHLPTAGLELFQIPVSGLGFDHDLTRNGDGYFTAVYQSPYIDEVTMDLALAVLGDPGLALGRGDQPDLFCLSLSAQDTVSHNYGSESEENLDVLRRLDLQLGRLLDALEAFPKGSVVLAFSSDHGFSPIPEVERKGGGRLVFGRNVLNTFLSRTNRLLDEELCLDPQTRPLAGSEGWNLVFDPRAFPATPRSGCGNRAVVNRRDLEDVLPRVVTHFFREEVRDVLLVSQKDRWPQGGDADFVREDFFAGRSGDAILIPQDHVLMHWDPIRGSGHGSQDESNIHVPLVFWGGGIQPGASETPSTPYDLAPTLGRLLGVALPDAVGRALALPR